MNVDDLKSRIAEGSTLVGFVYGGKEGNVDPYYSPQQGTSYLLFYDGSEQTVFHIDAVMNTPFIGGKTLAQAAEGLTITEGM